MSTLTIIISLIILAVYIFLLVANKSNPKTNGMLMVVQGALWTVIAVSNWAENTVVNRSCYIIVIVLSFICGIRELIKQHYKMGYSDDGPAWIGYVKTSKSKKTIYFNNHAFQKYNGNYSNYVDIENGDEYWISGLKKKESNRHWDGHGKIMIDRRAVNEYLSLIGERELPLNLFEVTDMEDSFPIERVNRVLNQKITSTDNFE